MSGAPDPATLDPDAVATLAGDVLDAAGGPLFEGYHAPGERPAPQSYTCTYTGCG